MQYVSVTVAKLVDFAHFVKKPTYGLGLVLGLELGLGLGQGLG